MKRERNKCLEPPDGGYGWIIVAANIICNACLLILVQCFGIIFQNDFQAMEITAAQTSFLLHLHSSLFCILSLLSSPLLKKYSFRQVALLGAFLMTTGIFFTAFASSYAALLFTVSILIGFGQGILMPALYLATNTYFKKRLTLAVSFGVTGGSVSLIFMPQICNLLLDHFGTKYTILILFAVSLHAFPCCLLLRPLKGKMKTLNRDKSDPADKLLKEEVHSRETIVLKQRNSSLNKPDENSIEPKTALDEICSKEQDGISRTPTIKEEPNEKTEVSDSLLEKAVTTGNDKIQDSGHLLRDEVYRETTIPKYQEGIFSKLVAIFDLELLTRKAYLLIIVGMGISFTSELNIVLMVPFVLTELSNFSREEIANFQSVHYAADFAGRLAIPLLAHKASVSPKIMYALSLIGSSVGRLGLVIFSDARLLLIYGVSIILGVSKGSKAVFQSLIIPKYVSLEKLPAATGLSMVLNGFLSLIIGPIIGLVHDLSSSYVYALHTASLLSLSCVLLWLIDALLKRRKLKHTATNIPI